MVSPQRSSQSPLAIRRYRTVIDQPRPRRHPIVRASSQDKAAELLVMMGVNVAIASVAILALVRLLPYNASQEIKFQALEAEVNALDSRVDQLRHDFSNYFDPQQTSSNVRILSELLENGQHKIIFVDPPSAALPPDVIGESDRQSE